MDTVAADKAHSQAAGSGGDQTLSAQLADFTLALTLGDVPAILVRKAKGHMLDALGIALASSGFEFAGPILAGTQLMGSGTGAHALASGAALPPAGAALVNGTLIHGLDFDDTHIGAIYHATAPSLAASLAAGEAAGVTGREFLTGFLAGLEIGCRLARAAKGGFHDRGFHPTALCGAFAAVFASGRLMGADHVALISATGLCGSMAAGLLELKGSWLKRMHPGWAAHSGVAATGLAMSGFIGPATMLEGGHGFYHAHLNTIPAGDASPAYGLGETSLIEGIGLKPYPCCHFIHGFVDCALELRSGLDLSQIERIDLPLSPRLHHLVSGPARPADAYSAMFSVPYVVALALVTGVVDLAAFHDKGVHDPQVLALADRTACSNDPLSDFPAHFPGEVRIILKNGEMVSHRVATSFGTPERPMNEADIVAKFMANATRVVPSDKAEAIVRAVWDIEQLGHVSELLRLCTT